MLADKNEYIKYLYVIITLEEQKLFLHDLKKKTSKEKDKYISSINEDKKEALSKIKMLRNKTLNKVPDKPSGLVVNLILSTLFSGIFSFILGAILWLFSLGLGGWNFWSCWILSFIIFEIIIMIGLDGDSKKKRLERDNIISDNNKILINAKQEENKVLANYKERNNQYIKRIEVCNKNNAYLSKLLVPIEYLLKTYYEVGLLYPKYHNLDAVFHILDYLASDRCNDVIGENGAYNKYENEKRLDAIINRLDTVIYRLDSMNLQLVQISKNTAEMASTLSKIQIELSQQNELISNYNNMLEKQNDEIISLLEDNNEAVKIFSKMQQINNQQTKDLLEYQNFALKQQRLKDGNLY